MAAALLAISACALLAGGCDQPEVLALGGGMKTDCFLGGSLYEVLGKQADGARTVELRYSDMAVGGPACKGDYPRICRVVMVLFIDDNGNDAPDEPEVIARSTREFPQGVDSVPGGVVVCGRAATTEKRLKVRAEVWLMGRPTPTETRTTLIRLDDSR